MDYSTQILVPARYPESKALDVLKEKYINSVDCFTFQNWMTQCYK